MFRTCIPLLCVALGAPVRAQTAPLTLDHAMVLALQASPQLAGARHEVGALAGSVLQAGARPNPVLDVGVVDTRRATRETTAQLSQTFELGDKRRRRVDAAERASDVATADLRAQEAELRAAVTNAFDDVLAAQAQVHLAEDARDVAARVTGTVATRVQAGKVSPVEETRARVAEANARLDKRKADGDLAMVRQVLATLWGSLSPQFTYAEGNLDVLPTTPEVVDADNAPALARARTEIARRQAMARLELSRRTPDVTVVAGIKRNNELGLNQAVFGVSFPLPLFDRNQGNVLDALRRVDHAEAAFQAAQGATRLALAQAHQEFATARAEVQALADEILPGAQSAADAAVKGFAFGKFAYVDVLDAQRTLILTKTRHLRALRDARRAATSIARLTGNPSRQ